jgi:hypothetical protein
MPDLPIAFTRLRIDEDLPDPTDYIRLIITRTSPGSQEAIASFAVHKRIARHCRLLDAMLDSLDVSIDGESDASGGVSIPDVDPASCESVLTYLDIASNKIPTVLPRPLRAPLNELIQTWELDFLMSNCVDSEVVPQSRIVGVMRVSDFLIIDSLRDLTCACLASTILSCSSEQEVLKLLGLPQSLTRDQLQPLLEQFPFLS